jgi:hypothetical protein
VPERRWDDRVHDAEDIYRAASMSWGSDAQMAKAAEEFAELSAVCARDINRQADKEQLLAELIDARIMIEQIAQHITDGALEEMADEKLTQLDDRLEEHGRYLSSSGGDGGER